MFKKLALAVAVSLAVPAASMACEGHKNVRREKLLKKRAEQTAAAKAKPTKLDASPDQTFLAQAAGTNTTKGTTAAPANTGTKKRKPKASQTSAPTTTPAPATPAPATPTK